MRASGHSIPPSGRARPTQTIQRLNPRRPYETAANYASCATFGCLGLWCQAGGSAAQGPKSIPNNNSASPATVMVLLLAGDTGFADLLLLATDRSSVSKLWNSSQQPQKTSSNPALYQTCPDGRPSCGGANVCCSGFDKCCWNGNNGRYECMSVTACPNRQSI